MPLFQVVLNTDDREQYVKNMSKAPIGIRIQQLTADIGINDFNVLPEPPWNLVCWNKSQLIKKMLALNI